MRKFKILLISLFILLLTGCADLEKQLENLVKDKDFNYSMSDNLKPFEKNG